MGLERSVRSGLDFGLRALRLPWFGGMWGDHFHLKFISHIDVARVTGRPETLHFVPTKQTADDAES